MPADDEGKLIAYKWRKSAILETPAQNFLPRRRSSYAFSQTPLTPTWEKSGKVTPPPEIFSARGSSSSFSPFTLKCPNSSFLETSFENFLKLLRASINSHRSPMRILPTSPPVSGCILPATLLCKNRGKVAPPPENFSARESSSNVQNRAFWKPLPEFFEIPSYEYQQPLIIPENQVSVTSCQRLHIARCPSM